MNYNTDLQKVAAASVLAAVLLLGQNVLAEPFDTDNLNRGADLLAKPGGKAVIIATISREALKAKLDRAEQIFLVEATDRKHFLRSHLPGSIDLELKNNRKKAPHKLPDRSAEVVIYSIGTADQSTDELARDLVAMGYTNVRIYPGGLKEWIARGYSTVGSHPKDPDL